MLKGTVASHDCLHHESSSRTIVHFQVICQSRTVTATNSIALPPSYDYYAYTVQSPAWPRRERGMQDAERKPGT